MTDIDPRYSFMIALLGAFMIGFALGLERDSEKPRVLQLVPREAE